MKKYNKLNVISNEPYIYYTDNFITDEECKFIIEYSSKFMEKAKVTYSTEEEKKNVLSSDYKGRTNDSYWIDHYKHPIMLDLCKRISDKIDCNYIHFEKFQVIHYKEGEEYNYHYDGWDYKDKERYKKYCSELGNRKVTILCYLNDVEEGGETGFDMLYHKPIKIKAKKGRMVVFYNLNDDGSLNKKTRHAGLPIIKGEKWAFNLWLRDYNFLNTKQ